MIGATEIRDRFDLISEQIDNLIGALDRFPATSQEHSPQYREWQVYRDVQSVVLSGGAGTVTFLNAGDVIPIGWEAEIQRYAVSVDGASSAATVAVYNGEASALNLVDFAPQLFGSSPSRAASQSFPPIQMLGGEYLTFVIAGAAGGGNAVVRCEGRMRAR